MITEADIARINELARKSKTVGLTPEEKEEQAKLRGEFILAVRRNIRGQLDNIDVENPDGTIESLKERREKKMAKEGKKPLS